MAPSRAAGPARRVLLVVSGIVGVSAGAPREEFVSTRPLIIIVRDWATPEECRSVLQLLERCHAREWPHCKEVGSRLHKPTQNNRTREVAGKPWRNSTSYQLELQGELDKAVDGLVQRAHVFARHPITYGEGVQVASYHEGSYYEFHHDSLSRRATMLLYLTDVAEGDGGETIFPLVRAPGVPADREPPLPPAVVGGRPRDRLEFKIERMEPMAPYCDSDFYLKVRPEAGKAVLFFSYRPDYSLDEYAVHGACPVRRGHKAILQRWMRFDENTLFKKSAAADEHLRRARVEWGHERLLRPGVPAENATANGTANASGAASTSEAPASWDSLRASRRAGRGTSGPAAAEEPAPEQPPRHEM